jgi:hypothetical protein
LKEFQKSEPTPKFLLAPYLKRAGGIASVIFKEQLRHCCCHLAARFSTAPTGGGATLTVFAIVFLALSRTAIARFSTDSAQLSVEVRLASHETSADVASIGAVSAELNTPCHHLHHIAI